VKWPKISPPELSNKSFGKRANVYPGKAPLRDILQQKLQESILKRSQWITSTGMLRGSATWCWDTFHGIGGARRNPTAVMEVRLAELPEKCSTVLRASEVRNGLGDDPELLG
jgi:hypothetical protein